MTRHHRLADRYAMIGSISLGITLITAFYDRLPLIRLIDWIF